jgi:hypothetical protein
MPDASRFHYIRDVAQYAGAVITGEGVVFAAANVIFAAPGGDGQPFFVYGGYGHIVRTD